MAPRSRHRRSVSRGRQSTLLGFRQQLRANGSAAYLGPDCHIHGPECIKHPQFTRLPSGEGLRPVAGGAANVGCPPPDRVLYGRFHDRRNPPCPPPTFFLVYTKKACHPPFPSIQIITWKSSSTPLKTSPTSRRMA